MTEPLEHNTHDSAGNKYGEIKPKTSFIEVQGKKIYAVNGADEITMFDGSKIKMNPEPLETPKPRMKHIDGGNYADSLKPLETPSKLDEILDTFRRDFYNSKGSLLQHEAMVKQRAKAAIERLIAEEVRKAKNETWELAKETLHSALLAAENHLAQLSNKAQLEREEV